MQLNQGIIETRLLPLSGGPHAPQFELLADSPEAECTRRTSKSRSKLIRDDEDEMEWNEDQPDSARLADDSSYEVCESTPFLNETMHAIFLLLPTSRGVVGLLLS